MDQELDALVRELGDSCGDGEEAKDSLIRLGPVAVRPVQAAIGQMNQLGKLQAIELFEAIGDHSAAPTLTALLADNDSTVREWSARLLGEWRYEPSGPPLRELHARLLAEAVPPHWTEPMAVRRALAALGLRSVTTPERTASLQTEIGGSHGWTLTDAPTVIRDLADRGQFVLHLMAWQLGRHDALYWVQSPEAVQWQYESSMTWAENVRQARHGALATAASLPSTADLVMIDWMAETDMSR